MTRLYRWWKRMGRGPRFGLLSLVAVSMIWASIGSGCATATPPGAHTEGAPSAGAVRGTRADSAQLVVQVGAGSVTGGSTRLPQPTELVSPIQPATATAIFIAPEAEHPITTDQVTVWVQEGTRDDIVIDRIERSNTKVHLTAADEQDLRRRGVSEDIIAAIRETTRR